jgi:hypothetical protein
MKQDSSFSRNRHNRSLLATLAAMFSQVDCTPILRQLTGQSRVVGSQNWIRTPSAVTR